jgi:hypothetical protein
LDGQLPLQINCRQIATLTFRASIIVIVIAIIVADGSGGA